MAFEIDLSLGDAFIQHLSGWSKAVLLSSSNFNTDGLALKICWFPLPSPSVGGGELGKRVGHSSKMTDHFLKILGIFEVKKWF